MSKLGEIENICRNISTAPVGTVRIFHKLVYGNDGDRQNRKRLREFSGFLHSKDSDDYANKVSFVKDNFKERDLIAISNMLCLSYEGTYDEVMQRILDHLSDLSLFESGGSEQEDDDKDDDDDDDVAEVSDNYAKYERAEVENKAMRNVREYHSSSSRYTPRQQRLSVDRHSFALTFRDVESSIRPFDGSRSYPIRKWIMEFEEIATLMGWDEMQMLVFAKKSMTGLANLFIQSETGISSWYKLREALKEEFDTKTTSAELHKLLSKRKKQKNESLSEYFFVMKEIASRGDIDNDSLFQYVIDGIGDDSGNIIILYGAKNLKEFKEKLHDYERVTERSVKEDRRQRGFFENKPHGKKERSVSSNCFNCGEAGHKSVSCPSKEKGLKCFRCNKFGHKSVDCSFKAKQEDRNSVRCVSNTVSHMKTVQIGPITIEALIDTGCQLNLIREDLYEDIGSPPLNKTDITLTGFGKNFLSPRGYFRTKIQIEEEVFEVDVYVVSRDTINMLPVIIGNELLSQAEMTINREGIRITKEKPNVNEIREKTADMYLLSIDVTEEEALNIQENVAREYKEEIEQLVNSYEPEKIKESVVKLKITMKDDEPIFSRPRRLSPAEKSIVDNQVKDWLEQGIIEPSSSEYASQVVVVKKKDGSPRVCIDYRRINKSVVKDRYPLPLIEDLLDKLQGSVVFSTLDLKNGFFHVPVEEESRKYTSFVTHSGQYQFTKTPFGLCNSPAVFQRFINCAFRPLVVQGIALIYMDDIIIPAKDNSEALQRLKLVLDIAKAYGLVLNKKKCNFLKTSIEFLGHLVENGKIYPSPEKTAAVMNFPEPTTAKQVQSFLGLSGYFRKFIRNYSIIARPLSDLLKKDVEFKFEHEQRAAFAKLKETLCKKPVLSIFNPSYETELHTDASKHGYGAVLLQKLPDDDKFHPVYFMSKKTTPQEEKHHSYELEVLAIITALKKFRVYLLGVNFTIVTDCAAFQKTMHKKDLTPKVARWALMLEEFQYTIVHRSGSRLLHVDALSRHPVLYAASDGLIARIKKAQREDDGLNAIRELLKERPYKDFMIRDDMLFKFREGLEVLVVPKGMQEEVIKSTHEKGHFSVKRTEDAVNEEFYIPDLKRKVERVLANCVRCILINRKVGKQEGLLHPLFKESLPLHTYHIDHLGPLESTHKSYKYILSVIDGFTKFVWLYPTKSTTAGEVIAKLELQKAVFGNPAQIISDRGSAFTSKEFEEYCKCENIAHKMITTGLPRANGQVERINSIVTPILAKMSDENPTKWYKYVEAVQRAINSSYQRSINRTPFELLTGVRMRNKADIRINELISKELVENFEEQRDHLREQAKNQILKIQKENQEAFNRHRRPAHQYQLDDLVAVKRTQIGPGTKMKSKYLGPYRVVKKKANNTYDVLREGDHEGPKKTSTCAEFMKPWPEGYQSSGSADM